MPKRRRISIDTPQHPPSSHNNENHSEHDIREHERRSIINSELDLEIILHERLAQRLEGRLQLTEHLIGLLDTDSQTASTPAADPAASGSTLNGWQDVKQMALDALKLIDGPTDFLFAPPAPPPRPAPDPSHSTPTPDPNSASHALRQRPERSLHPRKVQFLYTQPQYSTSTQDGVKVLRCPTCLRTTFTSLQGLLNHARLSHKVQYASHDECVWACAVPVEELASASPGVVFDTRDGLLVGSGEGAGKVRGLKRLFEDAVGAGKYDEAIGSSSPAPTSSTPAPASEQPSTDQDAAVEHPPAIPSPVEDPSRPNKTTEITRTLGYHADTPALAPFLGKAVIKQGIKVRSDETASVDVDAVIPKRTWRKPFVQRNAVADDMQKESYMDADPPTTSSKPTSGAEEQLGEHAPPLAVHPDFGLGTRFHIPVRLVIADHSLWIPTEKQYKWMITIDSPGYSAIHISSFVSFIKVTTEEEESTILECHQQPFYVLGTTNKPFLAKLEIQMVSEQVLYSEHWVDIDPLQRGIVTLGDEQIRDFGLDRKTVLKPAVPLAKGARPSWDVGPPQKKGKGKENSNTDPPHEKVLKQLVKRYPMTTKEYKRNGGIVADPTTINEASSSAPTSTSDPSAKRARSTRSAQPVYVSQDPFKQVTVSSTAKDNGFVPGIPYRLVTSMTLKGMVMGKRKALEWARAKAIQEAYTSIAASRSTGTQSLMLPPSITQSPMVPPPTTLHEPELIPLTVGDVYAWLEDNGHFHWQGSVTRAAREKPSEVIDVDAEPQSTSKPSKRKGRQAADDEWCDVCGLLKKVHPGVWRRDEVVRAKKRKRKVKVEPGVKMESSLAEQMQSAHPLVSAQAVVPTTSADGNLLMVEQGNQLGSHDGAPMARVKMEEEDVEMASYPGISQSTTSVPPKSEPEEVKPLIGLGTSQDPLQLPTDTEPLGPFRCDIVTAPSDLGLAANSKIPLFNVQTLLDTAPLVASAAPLITSAADPPSTTRLLCTSTSSHEDLAQCADPQLITSISNIVSRTLNQPSPLNPAEQEQHDDHLPQYPPSRSDLLTALAPYSLLGILTKSFMKRLLGMGIRVAAEDMERARAGHVLESGDNNTIGVPVMRKKVALGKRLLLPSHVIRGLSGALRSVQDDQAALLREAQAQGVGSSDGAFPVSAERRDEQNVAVLCSRLGTGVGSSGGGLGSDSDEESESEDEDEDEDETSGDDGSEDGEE